jgi:ribonucleotide reductase alpha subunit
MKIIKRNGSEQQLNFEKIHYRIAKLVEKENSKAGLKVLGGVNLDELCIEIISNLFDGISTTQIDEISARLAAAKIDHPDYNTLAARISISNLHKNTPKKFSEAVEILHSSEFGQTSVIDDNVMKAVRKNKELLDKTINFENDYLFDFFGLKTLERSYLLKKMDNNTRTSVIIETPQFMMMRVALGLHNSDGNECVIEAIESYKIFSDLLFTHASPTLFNSGTKRQQNSSCFLLSMDDSLENIMETVGNTAQISKFAGGIGLNVGDIRGKNSIIKGTGGKTESIIPMLRLFNDIGRYVNQGGKRKGSIAVYLPTNHPDIMEFLDIRKNTGDENLRTRDLFSALWISDYFMECVENDLDWDLLSADDCPDLSDAFGEAYKKLHQQYVSEGKSRETLKAREVWSKIIVSQIETGMPYMLYSNAVNQKNNQKNLGTIKNSNLCVAPETMILTREGYFSIESLAGTEVEVWNGEEFSKTLICKTGNNQPLIKVNLSNGASLECTEYHRFYTETNKKFEAKDLLPGMQLKQRDFPLITRGSSEYTGLEVPLNCRIDIKLKWLQTFIDRDLIVKNSIYILTNTAKDFLIKTQLLIQTLGCDTILEEDKNTFKLILPENVISRLYFVGINFGVPIKKCNKQIPLFVDSVVDEGRISDTYCFTEPKKGMGVFNGILTGNCAEVMLKSSKEEIACCNIATLSVKKFVEFNSKGEPFFNFKKLGEIVGVMVVNLNKVIDVNFYPVPETEVSNKRSRPIILGTQGIQNLFFEMRLPFESAGARELNFKIYETIQYYALKKSNELAKIHGTYSSFKGSPSSEGIFQHNMWGIENSDPSLDYDWDALKESVIKYGLRNSMLTAQPPTASTSQILGNFESNEPIGNNFMIRNTLSGDFPVINKYLVLDLIDLNLWNNEMKELIIFHQGSIQKIESIPKNIKDLYKTVWEISQRVLIDYSSDRGLFIDHSQSLNLFVREPSIAKISSMHFHGFKSGLKTGLYYLRSLAISRPIQFTVSKENTAEKKIEIIPEDTAALYCSLDNKENCDMCSG